MGISFLFMIIELLFKSWEWMNFIKILLVIIVLYALLYYLVKFINKKIKEKPASLPKEFKKKYPIIPQYFPPKGLNPAEAWLLYNCKVDVFDLTSLIYQWALEWLISIKTVKWKDDKETFSKIELDKLEDIGEGCPFFEQEIFNSIFCIGNKKVINNSFELRYALMLEDLEYHWIKKWWLCRKTGWKIQKYIYTLSLFLLVICSFYLFEHVIQLNWVLPIFSVFIVLLVACIFLWWYIDNGKLQLTDKWSKLAAYVIWYRNFIKNCDENMIKLYLKEDPLFIDKTLPYATAFGLETEFLNKVTPLVKDRKAKYINGHKVTIWMKIFAALLKSSNNDKYDIFYGW